MPRPTEYTLLTELNSSDIILVYQNGQMKRMTYGFLLNALLNDLDDRVTALEDKDGLLWSDD